MEDYPSDDELRQSLNTGQNVDATFSFQNATMGFDMPQYVESGASMLLAPFGELLSAQSPLPQLPPPLPGDQRALPDDLAFGGPSVSFADASWSDLTGHAFVPDMWNALSLPSSNTEFAQLGPTSPTLSTSPPSNFSPTTRAEDYSGESSENNRKRKRRIPTDARRLLEACFERHKHDPYVPQEEIRNLAAQTNLSVKQVRTFFANARARKLPRRTIGIDIPGTSKEDQSDPMTRFLSSSPEDEGISEEAVKKAATMMQSSRSPSVASLRKLSSRTDVTSETGISSHSGSSSSRASFDSKASRGPRRGRKRRREPNRQAIDSIIRPPSDPSKIYQCTFCNTDFTQKYDWKRHEESVHFPQTEWVCLPDGPTYHSVGITRCVFCEQKTPDDAHLETHNWSACMKTPRDQRTFLRKDKLVQHLTQVHRCTQAPKKIKEWSRPIQRAINMLCGLCGISLPDWSSRVDHVSSHFNDGHAMDMWMLEDTGGIVPHASTKYAWLQQTAKSGPTLTGEFDCEFCTDRFSLKPFAIVHQRQVHNKFSIEDKAALTAFNLSAIPEIPENRSPLSPPLQSSLGAKTSSQSQPTSRLAPSRGQLSSMIGVQNIRVTSNQSLSPNPHAEWRLSSYQQAKNYTNRQYHNASIGYIYPPPEGMERTRTRPTKSNSGPATRSSTLKPSLSDPLHRMAAGSMDSMDGIEEQILQRHKPMISSSSVSAGILPANTFLPFKKTGAQFTQPQEHDSGGGRSSNLAGSVTTPEDE